MAKSKKQAQPQLSPEAYIRKKARNLPLHECLINSNWKETGMAQIIVSRVHANGHLTFGVYLVDLYCVGVKDTFFNFNVDEKEYADMLDSFEGHFNLISADYILVHNIIFASIEYANELGIDPHKDFNMFTKFILEEDTDDVELIEIECGKNGQPFFVITDFYTPAQANGIIRKLEKAVGEGNFQVINKLELDEEEKDDFDFEIEYDLMTPKARKELFLDLVNSEEESYEVQEKLFEITDAIYMNDLCDWDIVEALTEKWQPELEFEIDDDLYSNESMGVDGQPTITKEDLVLIDEMLNDILDGSDETEAKLKKLMNRNGNLPYLCYMELMMLSKKGKQKEYSKKLEIYATRYPDYALLKIEQLKDKLLQEQMVHEDEVAFENIFAGRTGITEFDMFQYQLLKQMYYFKPEAFNALQALYEHYDAFEIDRDNLMILEQVLMISRVNYLQDYFKK